MTSAITIGGLTIHGYGIILAVAIGVGLVLVEIQARRQRISVDQIEVVAMWAVVFGLIGARLYHVLTDFSLYQEQLWTALYIWQGGLSVIGAIIGGGVGLILAQRWRVVMLPLPALLDLAVFGVPVSQAIGRVGNWLNQELYGWPSTLPWAIPIEPPYRASHLAGFETFHPLFLYEMIATLGFAGWVWWYSSRPTAWKVGSGRYITLYILYYCFVRFCLDFIRVDKTLAIGSYLGVNQLFLVLVMVVAAGWWWRLEKTDAT